MKLFTVGPVQMNPAVLAAGAEQPPYFRTAEFSRFMLRLEHDLLSLLDAPEGARAVFLTSSGSGAMDSAMASLFSPKDDRILIIRAGTFGNRFVEICEAQGLPYAVLDLPEEEELSDSHLAVFAGQGFTGITVNHCETSNGKLMDLQAVSRFAHREGLLTIVDAVSSFLCEPLSMKGLGLDLVLTASQKALALSPGIAPVALAPSAITRIKERSESRTLPYYLDLSSALKNMERGQTPFSPAISILQQMRARLDGLKEGADPEVLRVKALASFFRRELTARTSMTLPNWRMAAGVTIIESQGTDMEDLFTYLTEQGMVLNPCGGSHAKNRIRVGHMGDLDEEDYIRLLEHISGFEQITEEET